MWPVAQMTFAKEEPPTVLGLSFIAIIYEGFNAVQISHDERKRRCREEETSAN